MKALPPPIARKHKEVLDNLAVAEEALHERGEKLTSLAREDLALSGLDFLILYIEHVAMHRDSFADGSWQPFLVDFVQQFTVQDEDGIVMNVLAEDGIEDLVLDCCALEDEDDSRSLDERMKKLRDGLLDIRARHDEMSLF
jgi:hypothetical protein